MAFGTEPIGSGRFAVRKRARRSVKGRDRPHNFKARRRIAVFVRKSKYSARLRQTETRQGRRRAGTVFTINQSGRPPFLPHKAPKSRIDLFICYWNGSDERCRCGCCFPGSVLSSAGLVRYFVFICVFAGDRSVAATAFFLRPRPAKYFLGCKVDAGRKDRAHNPHCPTRPYNLCK